MIKLMALGGTIVIIVVVLIVFLKRKADTTTIVNEDIEADIEKEETSKENIPNETTIQTPIRIYYSMGQKESEDSYIWICPMCETENPSTRVECCVCHNNK